ncbi:hypothetical protein AAFF_G00390300 [Aldrovandia affinis]|uniref:Kelch-like protein 22 n=1 Tax=Aldrovandia affinis TaxID=143900 RepID=A0AAD7SEU0_9TELE|nr:hypothetical protein AAFF_G00390300 [Aldrovandia affinis]
MAEDRDLSPAGAAAPPPAQCSRQTYRSSAHSHSLLGGLLALRQGGILFDVVLLVEGRPIQAHRILLAASCDYFRGMFAGGLREMQLSEIPVHGVSHTAMTKLLDFIYTAELELDLHNVQEILCASTLLQIQDVIGFCCDFLFSWLDDDNILEVYKLADMYGLEQLGSKVHSYILKNIETFSRTPVYRQLPPEKVFSVLSSDELEVSSENEVYEAALHYHYSPEQVESDQVCLQDPLKMLEAVRFCLMERVVLQRLHDRLKRCPLRDCVAAALRYHGQELWQPILQSPLTQPRSCFRCILGFGGMYSPGSVTASDEFQVFHPSWGEWRTLSAAQTPRMSNQGVAVLNNFVYLIGGDKNTSGFRAETRCWRYDPRHNNWCSIKPLQKQHADHCVCVLGGHIYAIGGETTATSWTAWRDTTPRPTPGSVWLLFGGRCTLTLGRGPGGAGVARHGGAERARVYVTGGSNDERGYRRDVLKVVCYSPALNQWSVLSPLPAGHGEPGMVVLDSRIFILGGRSHDKGSRTKYVHVYDVESDRWESGTPLEDRISGLAACVLLMPRSVIRQARSWEQHAKASWETVDFDNSENSSED